MKKMLILLALATIMSGVAQEKNARNEESNDKTIQEVFGNFHTGFGSEKEDRGFALERCYLGYEYHLGNGLAIKGVLDVGKSADVDDYQRIAYLKNAMISWKTGNLTLSGGLIPTTQFHFQEKFWGCRYIRKYYPKQQRPPAVAALALV